ncbi:DUF6293 family protein [Geoglobus acetivorans]|uniref:DUF6293 family protein n=1 Tax=Geoglobus acetivorans TaxID=565033 RepID=A0ABZ3H232_GEOAI|nr:ArsR family transcriptional regulator [Geoglobus acetivorans]
MKVLVATVGGSADPIVISARKLGFDKAILLAGKPAGEVLDDSIENHVNPLDVAEAIRVRLETMGGDVEVIPVNPFDFEECCMTAIQAIENEKQIDSEIRVVISGGTKVQSLAASYAAYVCGCHVFYVQESKNGSHLIEIPLTFSELDSIPRARKDVLKVLEDGDDAGKIAEKLKISRKTASQYLKELREYGLVEAANGKARKYRLTFAGKICRARWR